MRTSDHSLNAGSALWLGCFGMHACGRLLVNVENQVGASACGYEHTPQFLTREVRPLQRRALAELARLAHHSLYLHLPANCMAAGRRQAVQV